jgi:hypothetical protein
VLLLNVRSHVCGRYATQKFNVFVGVELGHFAFGGRFCALLKYRVMILEKRTSKEKVERM